MQETLDRIAGDWFVYQLRNGHRFSTDDQVCAWHAAQWMPHATRLLDLGCGIGSVGLSTLHQMRDPAATLVGIEAQEISFGLAQRSVTHNGLDHRVRILHGDIRDPGVLPADARFDLITGSPPYFPLGTALVSPHPQRAACRMELRGSIYAYAEAARRWAAPGAGFCVVMAAGDPRTEDAPFQEGWAVLERIDYVFREGKEPTIATLFCRREEDGPHPPRSDRTVVIRDADGAFTDAYLQIRRQFQDVDP